MTKYIPYAKNRGFWVAEFSGIHREFADASKRRYGIDFFLKLRDTYTNNKDISFQIFNSEMLLSHSHVKHILYHVEKSFKSQTNISKNPAIEFFLYLTLNRQIQNAIEQAGVQFPKNLEDPIKFGIIFFGNIKEIEHQVPQFIKNTNLPLTTFEHLSSTSIKQAMNRYDISEKLIKKRYFMQHVKSQDPAFFRSESIQLDAIPLTRLSSIIVEILNQKMVLFYLNNISG